MQTVMVTGGAGYVGSGVLRTLLEEGHRVVCVDKLEFGGESILDLWGHPRFAFHKVDIVRLRRIRQGARGGEVRRSHPPRCDRRRSGLQTRARRRDANQLGRLAPSGKPRDDLGVPRFAFASTCSNYGKMTDPDAFVDESSPLAPVSLYAELEVKFEKYLLEEVRRTEHFAPVCLRFATVYGLSPRMRFDLTVNEFTKDLALGRELEVFGPQFWRPYCHVKDFANAFSTVLKAPREPLRTRSSTSATPRRTSPSRC